MKRLCVILLLCALCLGGCREEPELHLPGNTQVPQGVDWRLWESYVPAALQMGEEQVQVLIWLDEIYLKVYFDREEQALLGSFAIFTPLSDVQYSREHLRLLDKNGDGYDDICVPDLLPQGDRTLQWWLWDPGAEAYLYAPEHTQDQQAVSADIRWQQEQDFMKGTMDTPEGPRDLLILLEGREILVYLDQRKQQLLGTAQLPEPLSREALDQLAENPYWDCYDLGGDGWGDLHLPCRWEQEADGHIREYAHCWLWDPEAEVFSYDGEQTGY